MLFTPDCHIDISTACSHKESMPCSIVDWSEPQCTEQRGVGSCIQQHGYRERAMRTDAVVKGRLPGKVL